MGILSDYDPTETQEWVDSLRAVLQYAGPDRARFLLGKLREEALRTGAMPPFLATTPYRNTIPPEQEEKSPGNRELEHKIRSAIRWNAVAIILRANKESSELGGTSRAFNRRRCSTTSASAISGMRRAKGTAAICSTCKATCPREFTRGRSSRGGSPSSSFSASGRRATARASRRIRIPG